MRPIRSAVAAWLIAASAACWSAPPNQDAIPKGVLSEGVALSKTVSVAVLKNLVKPLNEDGTVIYFQTQGGGGLASGLIFGAIGVAANQSAIDEITTTEANKLRGRILLNPERAFSRAASSESLKIERRAEVMVTPYVLLSKISDDSQIRISAVLQFVGGGSANKWARHYQYELPYTYSLEELVSLPEAKSDEIRDAVYASFSSLIKYIQEEESMRIDEERAVTFVSPYLTPRRNSEQKGSLIGHRNGLMWVRRPTGVYAVMPADIKFMEQR